MQIKRITIKNLASFVDFKNETEFAKKSLVFGTNGAGKSTITTLLQMIDRYKQSADDSVTNDLKEFLSKRISKEANITSTSISIGFTSDEEVLTYDKERDDLKFSNSCWHPVKVFNDLYTERTIGRDINIDLEDNGLIVGEPNKELDLEIKKRKSVVDELQKQKQNITDIVVQAINHYREVANSGADVSNIISEENFLSDSCGFQRENNIIEERKKLGYSTPKTTLQRLDGSVLKNHFNEEQTEKLFQEVINKPELDKEKSELLIDFTDFYKEGIDAFNRNQQNLCPFCFREWDESYEIVQRYSDFITSSYNSKREKIKNLNKQLENYKENVGTINKMIKNLKVIIQEEGKKYNVNTDSFQQLSLEVEKEKELKVIISNKLKEMDLKSSIAIKLKEYENMHVSSLEGINKPIDEINLAIESIRKLRINTNKRIAEHLMKEIWEDNSKLRESYRNLKNILSESEKKIELLEIKSKNQDTVQSVFNGLLEFIGLEEYHLNNDKKLVLRLESDHDISDEGVRISSAQRKILSLCYFYAEIAAEIESISELRNYIIIYDDPVDSADYVYFHSITSVIENIEDILKKILNKNNVKFGQFFVFTHNSLLFDRLVKGGFEYRKCLKKENCLTALQPANKSINNYKVYLEYIIRFYKSPKSGRKEMIFIGNMIRRVLEILTNFNNLESNSFDNFLIEIGKPKLALIANHLSHESFTKVLNPFNDSTELIQACTELFEIIEENHPLQWKYIKEKMIEAE